MLPIVLILDNANNLLIELEQLQELLLLPELTPYITLLKQMTEFNSKDRLPPKESLKRYLNLIKD